ncbi:MAG TPA: hypothetical protein VLM38_24175 [Blastocatellia bacterium]|nr:hypothetical protein [Blastocatellia bacterium]
MNVDFAPIRITDCDENKVRKASGSKARYVVPFSLSAKPPRDWEDIFDDVWRTERKRSPGPKAQAYIRKGALVLESALDDIKVNFVGLRSSIDATNEKYAGHLQQRAEKDEKKKRKREEEKLAERQAIHEALQGLEID